MSDLITATSTRSNPRAAARPQGSAQRFFAEMQEASLVLAEDVDNLSPARRAELAECHEPTELLALLVDYGLVTDYQANRIEAGTTFGLTLGNYRVLDRLGAGGMGVVFRAEHIRMRKLVAVKVLPFGPEQDPRLLRRFLTEIRAIAQLQHPNIVGAIDAGEAIPDDPNAQVLHFFVMEYVPGQDLEEYVRSQGPLTPAKACDLMHQMASALVEANKHNLVHRDIKPSNIQVTPEGQAKLLDFGLARKYSRNLTEQGTLLGTLDYMAPEQIQDAHAVDIRADLYGLGGVLYWCLTAQPPFPATGSFVQELANRLKQQPPSVRAKRPDVPAELDTIVQKLMALRAEDRYDSPTTVMRALLPFLKTDLQEHMLPAPLTERPMGERSSRNSETTCMPRIYHILLVDDDSGIRSFSKFVLQAEGMQCDEAEGGGAALEAVKTKKYDLVLLDIHMQDMIGTEVCRALRDAPPCPNLKIIMASGQPNSDTMAHMLLHGADDFLTKPFSVVQLQSRVKSCLRLKDAQDRTDILNHHLLAVNRQLEQSLSARNSDLVEARNALVLALAKLVEHRANETDSHLARLQGFVRCLAEGAARMPAFAEQIDDAFIEMLVGCAPLHDIGKVGLPDHILMKPGKLDNDERIIMQAHTLIGAETLSEVAKNHPSAEAFLHMAIDIARHHHERFDGSGYPDRLAGNDIPLAARLVTVADVYDALRSRRTYKPALSHNAALQVMGDGAGTQLDPGLMTAFHQAAPQFERIFRENPD
ncbi:MAG: protein kinase [Planctomycetes bacterium]|nr:protein kinase [Planctomycetota bacterium]